MLISGVFINAQITLIPDTNFEQNLIWQGYDSGSIDGFILTANIDTISTLFISGASITDLTGIQDFIALKNLDCTNNQLDSLDISQNTLLVDLDCSSNNLIYLNVSQNSNLTNLSCLGNQLTNLNVTQNLLLTNLDCYGNYLPNLDVTQNTGLNSLRCDSNLISSLDVSQNLGLITLVCDANSLTALDVSVNSALTYLTCTFNPLTCLNVKNGNNSNFVNFSARFNSSLNCVEVDNPSWSTSNWTNIDVQTSFSINCNNFCTVGVNEYQLSNLSLYPNPTKGNISIDLGEIKTNLTVTLTNSIGQVILTQQFESTDIIKINIDALAGVYFLELETTNGETKTIKVLKK